MAEGSTKIDINTCSFIDGNPNCNNTCVLLKLFRSAAMTVAYKTETLKRTLENEYGSEVGEFLSVIREHNVNIGSNMEIVERINDVSEENGVLTCLEGYINLIKENHPYGNILYSVLYHTYMKKYKYSNEVIRENIAYDLEKEDTICERTYLKYLREAIKELDSVLWSSSNEYLKTITIYAKENSEKLTVSYAK